MSATSFARRGWRKALAETALWVLDRVDEADPAASSACACSEPTTHSGRVARARAETTIDLTIDDLERSPRWNDGRFDREGLDARFAEFMATELPPSAEERWLLS